MTEPGQWFASTRVQVTVLPTDPNDIVWGTLSSKAIIKYAGIEGNFILKSMLVTGEQYMLPLNALQQSSEHMPVEQRGGGNGRYPMPVTWSSCTCVQKATL